MKVIVRERRRLDLALLAHCSQQDGIDFVHIRVGCEESTIVVERRQRGGLAFRIETGLDKLKVDTRVSSFKGRLKLCKEIAWRGNVRVECHPESRCPYGGRECYE